MYKTAEQTQVTAILEQDGKGEDLVPSCSDMTLKEGLLLMLGWQEIQEKWTKWHLDLVQ